MQVRSTKESLLLGKSPWIVHNDVCECKRVKCEKNLFLSSCSKEEFSCDDGTCINGTKRCDESFDCADGSDEQECGPTMFVQTSYEKNEHRVKDKDTQTLVQVSVNLLNVVEINEMTSKFHANFELEGKWVDPTLLFYNLKPLTKLNDTDFDKIWKPDLSFYNINSEEDIHIHSHPKIIIITNHTSSYPSNFINIYEGKENPLKIQTQLSTIFFCDFDMQFYPFDTQECSIEIMSKELNVELITGSLDYSGPRYMFSQYRMLSRKMEPMKKGTRDGVRASFKIQRGILTSILTTFLPTLMIDTIGHATLMVGDEYFEGILGVNLTAMLVITTM